MTRWLVWILNFFLGYRMRINLISNHGFSKATRSSIDLDIHHSKVFSSVPLRFKSNLLYINSGEICPRGCEWRWRRWWGCWLGRWGHKLRDPRLCYFRVRPRSRRDEEVSWSRQIRASRSHVLYCTLHADNRLADLLYYILFLLQITG